MFNRKDCAYCGQPSLVFTYLPNIYAAFIICYGSGAFVSRLCANSRTNAHVRTQICAQIYQLLNFHQYPYTPYPALA